MKTIGLIGGMGWPSTIEYYRVINETVNERLGGMHSARVLLHSVDLSEMEPLQRGGQWEFLTDYMVRAANGLVLAGADCILICCNTMHRVADEVADSIDVPLIHIVDVTGEAIQGAQLEKVGLLGTTFVTEDGFYGDRLEDKFDIDVIVGDRSGRGVIHEAIYNELCKGRIESATRRKCSEIIENLVAGGAEGIILGCTELAMLFEQHSFPVPLFDTTGIHAQAAVDFALADQ